MKIDKTIKCDIFALRNTLYLVWLLNIKKKYERYYHRHKG